ncbi:MAG TPA: efflux RND transporter periplasmic adaptor subunit [Candidatus Acidoferrum sp.]|nr:efflux RND transporter periplasmic adaptor subunit [Candidatus Acidoferrum sp.]
MIEARSEKPDREPSPLRRGSREEDGRAIVTVLIILVILAAVVASGIIPRIRARAALTTETRELAIPVVKIVHPQKGAPEQEIVLPGDMQAFIDAPIYARTNGYLKRWYVDIGGRVKTGQLLADIETPEVDAQLRQALADLNTAEANFALSKITYDRYEGLKSTDSVAKQDVDNAVGAYQANKAMVASAQANVKRLQELVSFEKVYAPFNGVITARDTDIGDLIDAGTNGGTAKEMFHIAAIDTLRVYVNVPQIYSAAVRPGIKADLTLQEFPGRQFPGTLVRTANAIDLASRTLLVEVDVKNPTGELLPGAYTQVHLKIPSGSPTYIVPVTTLIFRTAGLQVALIRDGNKAELVPVTLGRDFGTTVEVVAGLTDSDVVIDSPPDSIVNGEIVKPFAPEDANEGAASKGP